MEIMHRHHQGISGTSAVSNRTLMKAALLILLAGVMLGSCSGKMEASIRTDGSLRAAIRIEVPKELAPRIRQFADLPEPLPLFDEASIRAQFADRKEIILADLAVPTPEQCTSIVWIPSLEKLVTNTALVPEGMISYKLQPGTGGRPSLRELSVNLTRSNASSMFALLPGLDTRIMESLNPPALEKDGLSAADYRRNLEQVIIGKKNMPAFDACAAEIQITAPRTILSASGGTASGPVFKTRIPLFDLLTLEKPLKFTITWVE